MVPIQIPPKCRWKMLRQRQRVVHYWGRDCIVAPNVKTPFDGVVWVWGRGSTSMVTMLLEGYIMDVVVIVLCFDRICLWSPAWCVRWDCGNDDEWWWARLHPERQSCCSVGDSRSWLRYRQRTNTAVMNAHDPRTSMPSLSILPSSIVIPDHCHMVLSSRQNEDRR